MREHGRGILTTVLIAALALVLVASACVSPKGPLAGATTSSPSFDDVMRQGGIFLNRGEYEKAVAKFEKAISLNDGSPKAHNFLGVAHFQRKDYALAEQQFLRAVALDPSFASAYGNLGSVYFVRNEYQRAKEMFAKALALAPNLVSANYNMGSVLIVSGDVESGIAYLSRAIGLDPDYLDTHNAFATSLASTSSEREVYVIYAKLFAATGNVEKALEYLDRAKAAGFRDWRAIVQSKEFDKIRDDPRIHTFFQP